MPAKSKTPARVKQAAEMLRDIYDRRKPETDFGTRVTMSRTLAHMARCFGVEQRKTKAETFLAIVEAKPDAWGVSAFITQLEYEYERAKVNEGESDPDSPHSVTERLKRLYSPKTPSDISSLSKVSRRLYALARVADLKDPRGRKLDERHMLYAESVALGFEQSEEAKQLRAVLAEVEEWIASWAKPEAEAEPERPARKAKESRGDDRYNIHLNESSFPHLGFVARDVVEATRADDIRTWEIVAFFKHGEKRARIGRAVAVTPDSITVRFSDNEKTVSLAELAFLGRVNPEPVGRDSGLSKDDSARVKELRAALKKLGQEDDQIIRCTRRYELEKEIYDIEHPIGDDADDWSAWEVENAEEVAA